MISALPYSMDTSAGLKLLLDIPLRSLVPKGSPASRKTVSSDRRLSIHFAVLVLCEEELCFIGMVIENQ